ncbi:cupin domain-containing protein [Thalassobacter stenotrophicus]|uniref:cupin domain-containing protein n=1 Tax=Thalassobacter stenotrophicus TaxID=266809 RepID=UPI0022A97B61|nr:cupin domain-containing protein [Thalassobacter stenotrophicus]UYP67370.1 cupin domain-containing protein [Thalassobacter stenotrophicus]
MTAQSILLRVLLGAATALASAGHAETSYPPVDVLLQSETTIIGQPIVYPEGTAQITAAIVTMQPGQVTGWHQHEAPLTAHMLQGELTVDYGDNGKRVYSEGDTLIEALGSRHNGENTGDDIARIFVVFSGAVGTPNTVSE